MGKSGVRITGDSRFDVPFGADRVIFLYLATEARRQGKTIQGALTDINTMFGVDWSQKSMWARMCRVACARYEHQGEAHNCCRKRCTEWTRQSGIVTRLWHCPSSGRFSITLTDAFVEAAEAGTPCAPDVVRHLVGANQLAALDLYLWYECQRHRDRRALVPALAPDGPYGVLKSARATSKVHQELRKAHGLIRSLWPRCPYRLVERAGATKRSKELCILATAEQEASIAVGQEGSIVGGGDHRQESPETSGANQAERGSEPVETASTAPHLGGERQHVEERVPAQAGEKHSPTPGIGSSDPGTQPARSKSSDKPPRRSSVPPRAGSQSGPPTWPQHPAVRLSLPRSAPSLTRPQPRILKASGAPKRAPMQPLADRPARFALPLRPSAPPPLPRPQAPEPPKLPAPPRNRYGPPRKR